MESPLNTNQIRFGKSSVEIPPWLIPKPPPRKKDEILHPAKFPETLVSAFIEMFSSPGGNILDPMVGTGSTVIAAVRSNRNGYGVDLMSEFIEIAKSSIREIVAFGAGANENHSER